MALSNANNFLFIYPLVMVLQSIINQKLWLILRNYGDGLRRWTTFFIVWLLLLRRMRRSFLSMHSNPFCTLKKQKKITRSHIRTIQQLGFIVCCIGYLHILLLQYFDYHFKFLLFNLLPWFLFIRCQNCIQDVLLLVYSKGVILNLQIKTKLLWQNTRSNITRQKGKESYYNCVLQGPRPPILFCFCSPTNYLMLQWPYTPAAACCYNFWNQFFNKSRSGLQP